MSNSTPAKPRSYYRGAPTRERRPSLSYTDFDGNVVLSIDPAQLLANAKPSLGSGVKQPKGLESHKVIEHHEEGKAVRFQRIYHPGFTAPGTRRMNAKTRRRVYGHD